MTPYMLKREVALLKRGGSEVRPRKVRFKKS